MLQLLLLFIGLFSSQALQFQDALKTSRWTLFAAHKITSNHVDVSWEDVKQIQNHYKAHKPQQKFRNTGKQWSVDHAFQFLLKNGRHFEGASIKAQHNGFNFEGKLHGVQYHLRCTHRCRVHQLGDVRDNSAGFDTHEDDMDKDTWVQHRESERHIQLVDGQSIQPKTCESCNCLKVVVSKDCEAHGLTPLANKQNCKEAMNDAVPEAAAAGLAIPLVLTYSREEVKLSPDCSTDGHKIIFNERAHNYYVNAAGVKVAAGSAGAQTAPWDTDCSVHEPCLCQYAAAHAKANHTGRLLCEDVHDDHIDRTMLSHPHVEMLTTSHSVTTTSDSVTKSLHVLVVLLALLGTIKTIERN